MLGQHWVSETLRENWSCVHVILLDHIDHINVSGLSMSWDTERSDFLICPTGQTSMALLILICQVLLLGLL